MNRVPRPFCRQPLVWRKPFNLGGPHQTLQGSEDTELRDQDQHSAFPLCPWSFLCGGSRAPSQGRCPPTSPRLGLGLPAGPRASPWKAKDCPPLPWQDSAGAFLWGKTPAGRCAISPNALLSRSLPFLRLSLQCGRWGDQPNCPLSAVSMAP